MLVQKEMTSMEEKIVKVLNEMSAYLTIAQMKKLQEIMLDAFAENKIEKSNVSNNDFLQMFLDAKKIEGCSERTIQYYQTTILHMFSKMNVPVRKITTEEIRAYLSEYQENSHCTNVKVSALSGVANIPEIMEQAELINQILHTDYLANAGINEFEHIRENLRDLMKYIPKGPKIIYDTNFADEILAMEWKESELENDDLKNYKAKAEYYVRQHQDNEAIAKLKSNKPLTSEDIKNLENILWSEIGTKQDYEAEYGEKPLGEFVREIVGLDMTAAKEAFAEYLDETNLDSRQIYFVNQIVEFIVHNGVMKDLSVLQEPPFTDQGSIVEVFTDLSVWMGIRKTIEQVNANALAA